MTVKELIARLQEFPEDTTVGYNFWDGVDGAILTYEVTKVEQIDAIVHLYGVHIATYYFEDESEY